MTEGLYWGLPVVFYLFLAGMGAGALTVSSSVLLRGGGGGFAGAHLDIARYGAFLAPIPIIVGAGLLVFELGSFEAGHWFKWVNLWKVINLSPMSIGTWLLTLVIIVSIIYAYTFFRNAPGLGESRLRVRRLLAWVGVPLGISVGVYTGVLLGAMPSRPFWNSPILALLFLLSSLSTGVALILLTRALLHRKSPDDESRRQSQASAYLLTATDMLLISFELMIVFLFIMFAYLTVGDVRYAISVLFEHGTLAPLFWAGFVALGLAVPVLIELAFVARRLLYHKEYAAPRGVEILVSVVVLIGAFLLRYIVVVAGQITGPVGV